MPLFEKFHCQNCQFVDHQLRDIMSLMKLRSESPLRIGCLFASGTMQEATNQDARRMGSKPRNPTLDTMTKSNFLEEPNGFLPGIGWTGLQLFRKTHLAGEGLELVHRRVLIITLVAWLPLLLLAALGSSTGDLCRPSFLHDVEVHVRFLIALPVLIAAELLVHSRIRPVVRSFVERRYRFAPGSAPLSQSD